MGVRHHFSRIVETNNETTRRRGIEGATPLARKQKQKQKAEGAKRQQALLPLSLKVF